MKILELEPTDTTVAARLRELASATDPDAAVIDRATSQRAEWRDILAGFMDDHDLDAIAYPVSEQGAVPTGDLQDQL